MTYWTTFSSLAPFVVYQQTEEICGEEEGLVTMVASLQRWPLAAPPFSALCVAFTGKDCIPSLWTWATLWRFWPIVSWTLWVQVLKGLIASLPFLSGHALLWYSFKNSSCQKPRETRGALIHSPRYVAGGCRVATAGLRVSLLTCPGAVEPVDDYRPSRYPMTQKDHPTNA